MSRTCRAGGLRNTRPRGADGRSLIGCLWTLTGYHSLVFIVNAGWGHVTGAVDAGPLAERDCQFQDCLASGPFRTVTAATLTPSRVCCCSRS